MTTQTKKVQETATKNSSSSKDKATTSKITGKTTLKQTQATSEASKKTSSTTKTQKEAKTSSSTSKSKQEKTSKEEFKKAASEVAPPKSKITVEPTKAAQKAAENSTGAGQFVGAFSSQPAGQVIRPNEKKLIQSDKASPSIQSSPKPSTKSNSTKATSPSTKKKTSSSKNSSKSQSTSHPATSFEDTVKSIGRQGAKAITHSLLGNKAPEVSKQVEDLAGNLVSSLIDNWLK